MTQNYKPFLQKALRSAVRDILTDVAQKGLTDDSHYFITFQTDRADVIIPDFVRAKYPTEISIILQNQFSNLVVSDTSFSVELAFGGIGATITVPYTAIKVFADPSAQFMLSFEATEEPPTPKQDTDGIIDLTSLRAKK